MKLNKAIREQVYNKYDGRCAYCGNKLDYKDMQVDHIIPISAKWINKPYLANNINNLMPSCRVCNNWKSNLSVEEFRKSLQNQLNILNRDSSHFRIACKYELLRIIEDKPIIFYYEFIDRIRNN
jgi:5-methylcytosine-specific restriction endonuclease McrA